MEKENTKKKVEELTETLNKTCTTIEGVEKFLKTKVKGIWYELDNKDGIAFVIVVKTQPGEGSLSIIFKPKTSTSYSAKVAGNIYRKDEYYTYLSKEATNTIKNVVLSTIEEKLQNKDC